MAPFSLWREEAKKHGFSSLIVLPLKMDGEVYGAMGIYVDEVDAFRSWRSEAVRGIC